MERCSSSAKLRTSFRTGRTIRKLLQQPDELKGMMQQPLQENGKQKEGEQPLLEDVLDDEQDAEQPTVIEPVAPTTQEQPVPTRFYIPEVPYPVPAKKSRKDCEEMKCKKMLEELNVKLSLMDAIQMIPSMRSLNVTIDDENAALTPNKG
ncbi:hypothetical protein F2Q69_00026637 [Brassica cretica]|uniref:Uncharacterized protein n=1 Tax=Brassica cretica TaxID=69181 RepID=A0A8S9SD09_BRACR|nr:hypothetical protein F2Q69_00026637 [Brassica cretica]